MPGKPKYDRREVVAQGALGVSFILIVEGFRLWYLRTQRYQDAILRLKVEEEAPAEVEDGPANAYRKWEQDEVEKLKAGFRAKKSLKELAKEHGRSRGAIRSRLVKVGLIEDPRAKP